MARPRGRAPSPTVLDKERLVVSLRRQGLTWEAIASEAGYSHPSGAAQAYERACARVLTEDVEAIRQLENDRLDLLLMSVWETALGGDYKAVDTVLKIMARRAKLLGLEVKPEQRITVSPGYTDEGVKQELERIMRAVEKTEALGLDFFDR